MATLTKPSLFLEALRRSSSTLANLPDEIVIPDAVHPEQIDVKPLLIATVDDIAFAQQGLHRALAGLAREFESLRRLHDMARGLGAKGADYAIEYLREQGETTS